MLRSLKSFSLQNNHIVRKFTNLTNYKFTKEHEWANISSKNATIGISNHAQDALGDVVFVELPEVGRILKQGESFGSVESVKAASDVYSPISGKVIEINENVKNEPSLINKAPYEAGWLIKVEVKDQQEVNKLLDSVAYKKHCDQQKH